MTEKTNITLRKTQLYCVFVRNHTKAGTLQAVEADLPRIKALGTDYVWLLPINPVGQVDRKGLLGSPYAIQDYRKIDPELGTWADFEHLVDAIHQHGMKLMIDIVYNHTSRDSVLLKQHPEWFLHNPQGQLINKNPEWSDVAELDYNQTDLWQYQIETLRQYAAIVDGFRCDVAPQVPIQFWRAARAAVAAVNPKLLWLAESTGGDYIESIRNKGYWVSSDSELYQAFDMTYDYDIDELWRQYLSGQRTLSRYVEALQQQRLIYPANYIKMRALENHDVPRAHHLFANLNDLINWTAFSEFQQGATLIYAGQEVGLTHTPSLFDQDKLDWRSDIQLQPLMASMHALSQDDVQVAGSYQVTALPHETVRVTYQLKRQIRLGFFTLKSEASQVKVELPDGTYQNLINHQPVTVHNGILNVAQDPIIIETTLV